MRQGGWKRWAMLLGVACLGLYAVPHLATLPESLAQELGLPLANFPSNLFTYRTPTGSTVRLSDFSQQGVEIQAIERTLGRNLANIPQGVGRFYMEATTSQPFVNGETHPGVWDAPSATGTVGAYVITKITCESSSGSLSVDLAIRHGSGAPASIPGANLVCPPGGATYTTFGGTTTFLPDDKFDVTIGSVTGTPGSLRMRWQYVAPIS